MSRSVKPSLFVAIGIAFGIVATVVAKPTQPQSPSRIKEMTAGSVMKRPASFVQDTKTGSCWLAVGYSTGDAPPSLAVAPPSACQ